MMTKMNMYFLYSNNIILAFSTCISHVQFCMVPAFDRMLLCVQSLQL